MRNKFWTLKAFRKDENINGKIVTFEVDADSIDTAVWVKDAVTGTPLQVLFPGELSANAFDGTEITIKGKTFVDVTTIIPSAEKPAKESAEEPEDDVRLIKRTEMSRDIHYGDGYHGYQFTFSAPIKAKDFIEFCYKEGFDLDRLEGAAWYEDHAHIYPGNHSYPGQGWFENTTNEVWTYLWVRAYTD